MTRFRLVVRPDRVGPGKDYSALGAAGIKFLSIRRVADMVELGMEGSSRIPSADVSKAYEALRYSYFDDAYVRIEPWEPGMRGRVLARLEEIRATIGSDQFGPRKRKNRLQPPARWPDDYDFSALPDDELLQEFEKLVHRAYRQR